MINLTFSTVGLELIICNKICSGYQKNKTVILSGFDPVRREIARLSLEKLINDGRIHPVQI